MNHGRRILIISMIAIILSAATVYGASMTASYSSDYTGFKVGETYRLHVELVDVETGAIARNGGTALIRDVSFKAKSETMNVKASLSIDTKSNAGKTLAMKAKLCKGGKTIAVLSDGSGSKYRISVPAEAKAPDKKPAKTKKPANNKTTKKKSRKKESVKDVKKTGASKSKQSEKNKDAMIPEPVPQPAPAPQLTQKLKINSEVIDGATGTHECKARTNTVIVDVLSISGLVPGQRYEITTKLVDSSSGKLVVKGAKKKDAFEATKSRHELKHKVAIDATNLAGRNCIAVSEVKSGGTIVGETSKLDKGKRTVEFIQEIHTDSLAAARYRASRNLLVMADAFVDLFANGEAS